MIHQMLAVNTGSHASWATVEHPEYANKGRTVARTDDGASACASEETVGREYAGWCVGAVGH
eukprot:9485213-Prorocentrum_lima.AAC.1